MAAKLIQSMGRSRLAKKKVRALLSKVVDKVHDSTTNSYYYYNRSTGLTSYEKSVVWGQEDIEDYNGERAKQKKHVEEAAKRSSHAARRRGSRR